MSHYCRDVQLFHNKFGLITPSDFTFINQDVFNFRVKFFYEELNEYIDACRDGDLATAVDSLIDLVYITCGTALFHGIGFDKFEEILEVDSTLFPASKKTSGRPRFLSSEDNVSLIKLLTENIEAYIDGYTLKDAKKIKKALGSLYLNCLFASTRMDLTNEQWDELWLDVQKCNMSKERAKTVEQSKRGSTLDMYKPEGWQPPRTEELLQKFINGGADESN